MSARLFPFWWLVAPELVTVFTVYDHVIDGDFSVGESLIGGAQTIDGIVLMIYITDQDTVNDDYGNIGLFLNGLDLGVEGCYVDRNGDFVSMGESLIEGGSVFSGWALEFFDVGGELPHTSYNLKARDAGTYKKTVHVVVLHREAS